MAELRVEQLNVVYHTDDGAIQAVENVSFHLAPGRALGIVGESGCGKSSLASALLRILPPEGSVSGRIYVDDTDILQIDENAFRTQFRWSRVAMVFQGAMNALNPVIRIGQQIAEAIWAHERVTKTAAQQRVEHVLQLVGLAPETAHRYPHELSGGMRQRAMIALALACNPEILIADEPTTALDTLMQVQILLELNRLRRQFGLSLILISHDLSVVAHTCDEIAVMSEGRFVEYGPTDEVLRRPAHPYTQALVRTYSEPHTVKVGKGRASPTDAAAPTVSTTDDRRDGEIILEVKGLHKHYSQRRRSRRRWPGGVHALVRAVDGVDLTIRRGEIVGLVGESGCGKTTLGRTILRLEEPTAGSIMFQGIDLARVSTAELRRLRRHMQIMYQDPFGSLNPRLSVLETVAEPLHIQGWGRSMAERKSRVVQALADAGIKQPESLLQRYPGELSGGQRQRVALARALVLNPVLLVADEPLSMLDASLRADVIRGMMQSVRRRSLSLLFITHDLSSARYVCDRIAVMYMGKIVELAPAASLFERPLHPYTQALLDAVLSIDPGVNMLPPRIAGDVADHSAPPAGCRLHPRCPLATERCRHSAPGLEMFEANHAVACHHGAEAWTTYALRR